MLLVDSTVWIDYFNGNRNPRTDWLDNTLGQSLVITGDLIMLEVLQRFNRERDFTIAQDLMTKIPVFNMLGKDAVLNCAANYRHLRRHGVTVRKTIDVIIATFCITISPR